MTPKDQAPMKTVRLGLIGCGALGKAHAASVAKIPQAKFVAYADAAQAAADACLKEFGGEYEFSMPDMACAGAPSCEMRFQRK